MPGYPVHRENGARRAARASSGRDVAEKPGSEGRKESGLGRSQEKSWMQ